MLYVKSKGWKVVAWELNLYHTQYNLDNTFLLIEIRLVKSGSTCFSSHMNIYYLKKFARPFSPKTD